MSCFSNDIRSLPGFLKLLSNWELHAYEKLSRFSNLWEAIQKMPPKKTKYRKASAPSHIGLRTTTDLVETALKYRNHMRVGPTITPGVA